MNHQELHIHWWKEDNEDDSVDIDDDDADDDGLYIIGAVCLSVCHKSLPKLLLLTCLWKIIKALIMVAL